MKILGLSGSPTAPSKTLVAVEVALKAAAAVDNTVQTELINIRDYDVVFCDARDPADYDGDTRMIIDKVVACDGLIVGTPMYRGAYTGILKNMFDILPNDCLFGKPVGIVATGGSDHHYLAIEHELKPLLGFFSAHAIPGAVYANNSHFDERTLVDEGVLERLNQMGRAVAEFAAKLDQYKETLVGAAAPDIKRVFLGGAATG